MPETETRTEQANSIVRQYMLAAAAVGLIPLPLLGTVALSGIQLKMLSSLADLYGIAFSEQLGKAVIAALLGGGVSLSLASGLVSLVRNTPLGMPLSLLSLPLTGGASTFAIGKVFIQHFDAGGTLLNFDPEQVRDYYSKQLEKGEEEIKSYIGIKP